MKCFLALMALFFTTSSFAAQSPLEQNNLQGLVMIGGFVLIFYFLMVRPQQKRAKAHKALLSGITQGDEVLTSSGLLGKVLRLNDQFIVLSLSQGVEMTLQKNAIRSVLPKGTLASAIES